MALRVAAGVDQQMPGITGWAQVNGRDEISLEQKVALEKEYMEKRNLEARPTDYFRHLFPGL